MLLLLGSLSDPPELFAFIENVATRIPAKWESVGIALGINIGSLKGFSYQHHGPQKCYAEIFQEWTNSTEQPKWKRILEALRTRTVNEIALAEELERKLGQ